MGSSERLSMRRGAVLRAILGASLAAVVMFGDVIVPSARATDNVDSRLIHWHFETMPYRLNTALAASWKSAISSAALTWSARGDQGYSRSDETGSTDPEGADHIVWEGQIPSAWQDGCPPSRTLACTRWRFYQETYGSWHMSDADIVFNEDKALGTSTLACPFEGAPQASLYDVETVALHEFGHANALGHTDDASAAMYPTINDCQRNPAAHDISSMNRPYDNH